MIPLEELVFTALKDSNGRIHLLHSDPELGQQLSENGQASIYHAALSLDNGGLVHLCSTAETDVFSEPEKLAIASLVEGYCHLFYEEVPLLENAATTADENDEGCGWCGNPTLEIQPDYRWCPQCGSGRFFQACPLCEGDLDASLDPLANCRVCGQQRGAAKAVVVEPEEYLRGDVPAIEPELKSFEELQRWVKALEIPFDQP